MQKNTIPHFSLKQRPFLLLTLGVFALLLLPTLVQDGMFLDGITYAAISRNLAIGEGSFWFPTYTETLYPHFHEQPPLAFYLQSLWFTLLGDNIYPERLYSFISAILTGVFIVLIWRQVFHSSKFKSLYWLPLLLWITTPIILWSYRNNMLENTVSVFTLGATYLLMWSMRVQSFRQSLGTIFLAGGFILLGFLSKGFVALFPLIVIPGWTITTKQIGFMQVIQKTSILVVLVGALMGGLWVWPEAQISLTQYIETQLVPSLQGEKAEVRRWYMLERLFFETLPMVGVVLLLSVFPRFRRLFFQENQANKLVRLAGFFLLIGLSATLPICLSPKQVGYYLVPGIPYFALAVATALAPVVSDRIAQIRLPTLPLLTWITSILFIGVLLFSISKIGKTHRDQTLLADIYRIIEIVGPDQKVSIPNSMYGEWKLHAYFSRYGRVSLDKDSLHTYYLTHTHERGQYEIPNSHSQVEEPFEHLILYQLNP